MPTNVKKEVIKSLLSEQGHLCAYCMSRIDENEGKHKTTIEHCLPQAVTSEKRTSELSKYGCCLLGKS